MAPIKRILPPFIIAVLTAVVFSAYFAPILWYDDWQYLISNAYFGHIKWFNLAKTRIFDFSFFKLVFRVLGLNVTEFYAVKIALIGLAAILIYMIYRRIRPQSSRLEGLALALVYLIYPADQTRMWLTMISPGWVATLLYALLLVEYWKRRRVWLLAASLACLVLPLLEYEGQFGVAMAWSVLLFIVDWRQARGDPHRQPDLRLLSPLVIGAAFVLWKVWLYPLYQGIGDSRVQKLDLGAISLLTNLASGMKALVLGWGGWLSWRLNLSEGWAAALLGLAAISVGAITGNLIRRIHIKPVGTSPMDLPRQYGYLFVCGLFLGAAGLVPTMAYGQPSSVGIESRYCMFALPGAALALVAAVGGLLAFLRLPAHTSGWALLVAMLPFIAAGSAGQVQLQKEALLLWQDQKALWNGFFNVVPALEPNTSVVIVVKGSQYTDIYGERTYLYPAYPHNEEVTHALRLLYLDETLSGTYYDPDAPRNIELVFVPEGYGFSYNRSRTPYQGSLFVEFDRATHGVKIITNLTEELGLSFDIPEYQPFNTLSQEAPDAHLRFLVQQ